MSRSESGRRRTSPALLLSDSGSCTLGAAGTERGYDGTSIRDIAVALGITKSSSY
jgi:hypothetical protein